MNIKNSLLINLAFSLLGTTAAVAQSDKVVVVPLGGEEIVIAKTMADFNGPTSVSLSDDGSPVNVATIDVNAPESGNVIVNFSTNFVNNDGGLAVGCDISLNGGTKTSVISLQLLGVSFANLNQGFTIGYPVEIGANTFVVTCSKLASQVDVQAQFTFITATFTPDQL